MAGIGERRVGYNPCGACDVGRCTARMVCSRLVDDRLLVKIRSGGGGAVGGSHKGSYGTARHGDGPPAGTGGRGAHTGRPGARRPRGPGRASAVTRFFTWCDARGLALTQISPIAVATYIEDIQGRYRAPSIKQHLAAIRRLFH